MYPVISHIDNTTLFSIHTYINLKWFATHYNVVVVFLADTRTFRKIEANRIIEIAMESILTGNNITNWHGLCTAQDRKALYFCDYLLIS